MRRILTIVTLAASLLAQEPKDKDKDKQKDQLGAKATSAHSVVLQGCSSSTPNVQYNFYRGTTAGGESTTALNPTPTPTCNWTDSTVTGGTTYYYTSKAYCSTCSPNLSGPSNEVSAVVPLDPAPAAPTGLTTGTISQNSVPLHWLAPPTQSGFTPVAFYVFRGAQPTLPSPSRIAIVASATPNYVDKTCKGTCYYEVKSYAIDPTGNAFATSGASNIVSAKQ